MGRGMCNVIFYILSVCLTHECTAVEIHDKLDS